MANLLHTCLCTADLEKGRVFYEALGFNFERTVPVVREGVRERVAHEDEVPHATVDWFGFGEQQMALELKSQHDGHAGEPHLGIFVDDLQGAVARLRDLGFDVEIPPYEPKPGVFIAFVRDADRNLVELIVTT